MSTVLVPERIEGAGVTLRPATPEEAEAVLSGRRPGHLRFGDGFPQPGTADGLRHAKEAGIPPGWWVDRSGEIVGDCGVHGPVSDDGEVEIGYGLAAPARGQGIGSELVRLLSGWLVEQPVVRTVVAHTDRTNIASQRVLERAGFGLTGESDGELEFRRSA